MKTRVSKLQSSGAVEKKVVVIIGAGFAGLNAAKKLRNVKDLHVILIDQKNHHLFQPLLYQVATAGLNPSDIAVPTRSEFSDADNIEVHLGRIQGVDLAKSFVYGKHYEIEFDYLIVACGAQHSYFGHPEWEEFAPGLKTLEQATEIRKRILMAFEIAENMPDPKEQKNWLTFVIVGGGPTGVELAGSIAEISRTVLDRDFKRIDPSKARVIIVEAAPHVLSAFHPKLAEQARKNLVDLGVEVRNGVRVDNIDADGVNIGEVRIDAKTKFWAAGVQAAKFDFPSEIERDRSGRVKVLKDFSLPSHQNIFVVGDMAAFELSEGKTLPGLAPVAIQSGKFVAETIRREVRGKPRKHFEYFDKGMMATIGKYKAVVQSDVLNFSGYFAWLAWVFIHILYLVGFRNRVAVVLNWTWSYTFSKRGARLITDKDWQLRK